DLEDAAGPGQGPGGTGAYGGRRPGGRRSGEGHRHRFRRTARAEDRPEGGGPGGHRDPRGPGRRGGPGGQRERADPPAAEARPARPGSGRRRHPRPPLLILRPSGPRPSRPLRPFSDGPRASTVRTAGTPGRTGRPLYEGVVQDLIDELGRLPGVGPKSAQRIAFHILQAEPTDVRRLAHALTEVKAKVRFCATCGNVAQEEQCGICRDARRDPAVICVVEEPKDVVAVERTREFRGRYHVLGGAISPIDG